MTWLMEMKPRPRMDRELKLSSNGLGHLHLYSISKGKQAGLQQWHSCRSQNVLGAKLVW